MLQSETLQAINQGVPDEEMHPQKVDHDEAKSCSFHDVIHVVLILENADERS